MVRPIPANKPYCGTTTLLLLFLLLPAWLSLAAELLPGTSAKGMGMTAANQKGDNVPCLVGMCTSRHARLLEEQGARPAANAEYCLLLQDYLRCLNASFRTCLAQLDFHSAITIANQRWRRFKCEHLLLVLTASSRTAALEEHCPFWDETEHEGTEEEADDYDDEFAANGESEQHLLDDAIHQSSPPPLTADPSRCVLFGQLHLRSFSQFSLEQCSFSGARPFLDNRFFLVQITGGKPLPMEELKKDNGDQSRDEFATNMATKVAVIIRPRKGCVQTQKLYLADSADVGPLPATFEDGETAYGDKINARNPVELVISEGGFCADILLHYLSVAIRIRKFDGNFLSIFVEAPEGLLQMNNGGKQLCTDGCWERGNPAAGEQQGQHRCPLADESARRAIAEKGAGEECGRLAELGPELVAFCVRQVVSRSPPALAGPLVNSIQTAFLDLYPQREIVVKEQQQQANSSSKGEEGEHGDGLTGRSPSEKATRKCLLPPPNLLFSSDPPEPVPSPESTSTFQNNSASSSLLANLLFYALLPFVYANLSFLLFFLF